MIRIIWRFDRAGIRREELLGESPPAVSALELDSLVEVSPVFSLDEEDLAAEVETLEVPENDTKRYFQGYVEHEAAARPILAALEEARRQGKVDWFDQQAEVGPQAPMPGLEQARRIQCPPDPGGATPAWDACQVYLGPPDSSGQAPSGVDARFAWGLRGGRGQRVAIVDVEGGWLLDHEDLPQEIVKFGSFPSAPQFEAHGSAVLGILCANPQDPPLRRMGVLGIAHRARVGVAPFQIKNGKEPNPEKVIKEASKWLGKGDVLLLELQATRPGAQTSRTLLPIEAWPHGRAAIKQAHDKGIYVVEVAANGGVTLSTDHGVPDSGLALMVGAGDIVTGEVLPLSNRGRRVDLQGWGDEVVTTGDAVTGYADLQARVRGQRCYTRSFSGTSSAGAIVAGCVAIISSVAKAHGLPVLTPEEMKGLLQRTGTFRDRPANQGVIGPLPNVRAALLALEERFRSQVSGFQGFQRIGANATERATHRRSRIAVPSLPTNGQQERRIAMARSEPYSKEQIQKAYDQALKKFGSRANVTGIDVGYEYDDSGERTAETAIRIHVREKLDESVLEAAEIFPEEIEGVPVDVIEAVYRPQAELSTNGARKQRVDPIQPGISCGHRSVSAGTLGALVHDRRSGKRAILSNWHILAGSTAAQAGDPILQPGPADSGRSPRDRVATLERWILNEHGDAAIALLNNSREILDEQLETGVTLNGARLAKQGDVVEKSGRTTGVTRGLVDGAGRYFLDYDGQRVGIDGFKIVSRKPGNPDNEEISSGGDSGSVWYIPDSRTAVGLHFAGETNSRPNEEHALACHLPRVLDALDVSLVSVADQDEVGDEPLAQVKTGNGHDRRLVEWAVNNRHVLAELSRIVGGEETRPSGEPAS